MVTELPEQLPLWVRYVSVFATPLVALVVGAFAAAQWFTANQKLRSDLIERRIDVFDRIQRGMSKFHELGHGGPESQQLIGRAALEAHLVFSAELAAAVDELAAHCRRSGIVAVRLHQEGVPVGDERTRLAAEKADLVQLMESKFGELKRMFLAEARVKPVGVRLFG